MPSAHVSREWRTAERKFNGIRVFKDFKDFKDLNECAQKVPLTGGGLGEGNTGNIFRTKTFLSEKAEL